MSKLTVIIPLLEPCEHISACIKSLVAQNIHTMDVLFVMDFADYAETASEIDALAREYAKMFPIRYVECKESHGLAAARNYGVANCNGEYVTFMEPEDMFEAGTFQAFLDAVPNLPVPMVYCPVKPYKRLISGYHEEYEEELELLFETDADRLEKRPAMDQAAAAFDQSTMAYMVQLRDDLEDFSVLGCMFHRSFLKENDIRFSTDLMLYPDAPFICKVLISTQTYQAVKQGAYIRRNGTFRYALEHHHSWQDCLDDYMRCYDWAYSQCTSDPTMMLLVQETMCSRYVNAVVRLVARSQDRSFVEYIYGEFARQMKRVDKRVINSFGHAERKHLHLLMQNHLKESCNYMKTYIRKKQREHMWKHRTNVVRSMAHKLFENMDIAERWILFECNDGNRYYGDPKYIYQYLQDNYIGEYKCIWSVANKDVAERIGGKRVVVKHNSLRYFYYVLRAKYWIRDTRQPIWWYKAPEQVYISTWLGTPMQKLFWDKDAFADSNRMVQRGLKAQVEQWDAVISGNTYTSQRLVSGLHVAPEQILQIGNPRNDILISGNHAEYIEQLKDKMELPKDKRILFYAPVWREEEERDVQHYYKMQLGLHRIKEQMGNDTIILVRIHDYITDLMIIDEALKGFVFDVSLYDDVQELMLVSDALITDYSSMVFDYAVLRRPIFFYLYDYEDYQKKTDHFYYPLNEDTMPGPYCKTTQEIINYLKDLDAMNEEYAERYDRFYAQFCTLAGGSCERLARRMLEEMADIFAYEDGEEETR